MASLYSINGSRNIFNKQQDPWYIYSANNSALELSMGGNIGIANIWNSSPLGIASNPAKLSYHEGISTGLFYSYDKKNRIKQLAMYTTFTWHGIGLLIPMPTQKKKMGEVNIEYPNFYEDHFGLVDDLEDFVSSQTDFALGIEVLQFFNKESLNSPFKPKLSFGAKYYKNWVDLWGYEASRNAVDLGFILSAQPINIESNNKLGINLDVGFAFTKINLSEQKLQFRIDNDNDGFVNEDPFDYLDNDGDGLIDEDKAESPMYTESGEKLGIAAKLALPLSKYRSKFVHDSLKFSENLISIMIIFDDYQSSFEGYDNRSTGFELTMLDLMSYRCSLNNSSYGFGLNIDLNKDWSLQANMAARNDIKANRYDVAYRYKF